MQFSFLICFWFMRFCGQSLSQIAHLNHFFNTYSNQRYLGMGLCRKHTELTETCLNFSLCYHSLFSLENLAASDLDQTRNDLLTHFLQTANHNHLFKVYSSQRCLDMGLYGKSTQRNLGLVLCGISSIHCWQHHQLTLEFKGSVVSSSGQGIDGDNALDSDHLCGMHLESSVMDLANCSVWQVFLEEEVDFCTEAYMNFIRSVSFLGKQNIAHNAEGKGILVISSYDLDCEQFDWDGEVFAALASTLYTG